MRVDNIAALSLQNILNRSKVNSNSGKNTSGLKISESKNLKADIAVSEKMKSQIRELSDINNDVDSNESHREAKEVYSKTQKILSGMENIFSKLAIKEISKDEVCGEIEELSKEFVDISKSQYFNSKWLKNGLDPGNIVSIESEDSINSSLFNIDTIMNNMNKTGLYLDEAIKAENLNASKSRIHDVDMAEEVVSITKKNMLNQSSNAILAQSNKKPEQIIKLLE